MPNNPLPNIAPTLIAWQRQHGRHGLPWQRTRDPYHVWLSEVMLQQTQVATVIGYYGRFLAQFPTVAELAAASSEQVMALWAGLGYYSRARNLHRCAQMVMAEHGGLFPRTASALETLPGIGRSTAAAIAAFCFGERVAIFDANVRRVLARVLASDGDARTLWPVAEQLLPQAVPAPTDHRAADTPSDMATYTQALMDLGAMVCTPRKPRCDACPLAVQCKAYAENQQEKYPIKIPKPTRRSEDWYLLIFLKTDKDNRKKIWLERRTEKSSFSQKISDKNHENSNSIWAGLYCPPIFMEKSAAENVVNIIFADHAAAAKIHAAASISHALTHRQLRLFPLITPSAENVVFSRGCATDILQPSGAWFDLENLDKIALPTPVRKILTQLVL